MTYVDPFCSAYGGETVYGWDATSIEFRRRFSFGSCKSTNFFTCRRGAIPSLSTADGGAGFGLDVAAG